MEQRQINFLNDFVKNYGIAGKALTIGLDFDGTLVEHRYPIVGKTLPHCIETLRKWQNECNVLYILTTMRDGQTLEDAINWGNENGIKWFGIQYHPYQKRWTTSNKCHCNLMIDDRNFGQPLTLDSDGFTCVDWVEMDNVLTPIFNKWLKKK